MSERLLAGKQSGRVLHTEERNTPPPLSPSISPSLSLFPLVIIVKERIGGVGRAEVCVCARVCVRLSGLVCTSAVSQSLMALLRTSDTTIWSTRRG